MSFFSKHNRIPVFIESDGSIVQSGWLKDTGEKPVLIKDNIDYEVLTRGMPYITMALDRGPEVFLYKCTKPADLGLLVTCYRNMGEVYERVFGDIDRINRSVMYAGHEGRLGKMGGLIYRRADCWVWDGRVNVAMPDIRRELSGFEMKFIDKDAYTDCYFLFNGSVIVSQQVARDDYAFARFASRIEVSELLSRVGDQDVPVVIKEDSGTTVGKVNVVDGHIERFKTLPDSILSEVFHERDCVYIDVTGGDVKISKIIDEVNSDTKIYMYCSNWDKTYEKPIFDTALNVVMDSADKHSNLDRIHGGDFTRELISNLKVLGFYDEDEKARGLDECF